MLYCVYVFGLLFCFVSLLGAGPSVLQVQEDQQGAAEGGLDGKPGAHHVLLQAGHSQIRGLGAADTRGAVRSQGWSKAPA